MMPTEWKVTRTEDGDRQAVVNLGRMASAYAQGFRRGRSNG